MKILCLTPRVIVDCAGAYGRATHEVKAFGPDINPELLTDLGLVFFEGYYCYASLYDKPDPPDETV